jgi:carboxyl-terminal processing protease
MLSLALVAGFHRPACMEQFPPVIRTASSTQGRSGQDKVGQVLDLIDRQYVDTVRKGNWWTRCCRTCFSNWTRTAITSARRNCKRRQEPLEGSFMGIGVEFAIQRDTIVVIAPVEGGPSAALGIRAGDRIVSADSEATGRKGHHQ